MKIVVAPDSFKGSLSAAQVTDTIAEVLIHINPRIEIIKLPLADGGEGSSEILKYFYPYTKYIPVDDPLGRKIQASYQINPEGDKAFIESAKIIGLPFLSPRERNPKKTSSFGLGQAIMTAIQNDVKEICISLGGSATCDAGIGMLNALGFQFLDKNANSLSPIGENMNKIVQIIDSPFFSRLKDIKFNAICDVNNPLYGPNGAAYIYAPQKGASIADLPFLDEGLRNFAKITEKQSYCSSNTYDLQGTGAAGGIGFALISFLHANLIKGIEFILNSIDFCSKISGADLIITGEGHIDRQSLMGKVLSGVIEKAKMQKVPVVAIAGKVENKDEILAAGVAQILEISDTSLSLKQNMLPSQAIKNIRSSIINLDLRPSIT